MEDMKHFAEAVHPQRYSCAAQRNQKLSLCAGRERSPAMYAVYFRKHRRADFFCTPFCTVYAANCEHAPRRRPPRVSLCSVHHFLYRSCVKSPYESGVESYDLVSYLISVCVSCAVKQTLRTLALLPLLGPSHFEPSLTHTRASR